jgi:putative nucleotidyltransferase with HDIG domain
MAEYLRDAICLRQRPRILVVEDDPTIRQYCVSWLQHHYEVDEAANGALAGVQLQQQPYDLVLTDMQMPQMDGMELLEHLRDHYPDTGVIMMTAHATIDTAKQALKLGALDYLAKPLDIDSLERAVRTNLELRHSRLEKERLSDLVVMYQFSQMIASSLDMKAQLAQISDFLWQRFMPAELSVTLLFPEQDILALLIHRRQEPDDMQSLFLTLPPDCSEEDLLAGHHELLGLDQLATDDGVAGMFLRSQDRAIGYLCLSRAGDQPIFSVAERKLLSIFAAQIAASLDNARLYQQLRQQHRETIEALAEAIDARDAYTFGHSKQVTRYAMRLAEVVGLSRERIDLLEYAGLLHDIGKIGVRDHILLKPASLDDEEFAMMRQHPQIGAHILRKVQGLRRALPIVEGHHEQIDGNGYPHGLSAEQINTETRMLAIADTFEALTADRAYRPAMSTEQALAILLEGRGSKWDAELVDQFVELIRAEGEQLRVGPPLKQDSLPLEQCSLPARMMALNAQ